MEREVGGGIGMGNTCKPMAVSFQCMTKSTTIKKKKIVIINHRSGIGIGSISMNSWIFHTFRSIENIDIEIQIHTYIRAFTSSVL